jgi:hypothetical protein
MAEHTSTDANPGYETTDARITPLAQIGFFIAALMIVSFVSMILLFKIFAYYQPLFDDPIPPLADARVVDKGPRLQIDPPAQKLALRQSEEEILGSHGWVDEQVKVARIPVDRAIDLVSQGKIQLIAPVATGN